VVVDERLGDPRRAVDADQANAFRRVGGEAVCRSSRHREYVLTPPPAKPSARSMLPLGLTLDQGD
jgi:hypothetical protein